MRKLLVHIFLLFALLVGASCIPMHSEEIEPLPLDIQQLLPSDTVMLFEMDVAQAALLADYKPLTELFNLIISGASRGRVLESSGFTILERMAKLPWKDNLYLSYRLIQNGLQPIFVGQVTGEADVLIASVFSGTMLDVQVREVNNFKVRSLAATPNFSLIFATIGDTIIITINEVAMRGMLSPNKQPTGIITSRIWKDLPSLGNGTFVRGVADLESLTRLQPIAQMVFGMFGIPDIIGLQYTLGFDGKAVTENIKLLSAGPLGNPLSMFATPEPISDEGSAIPSTALASVRLNLNYAAIFDWFTAIIPQLGNQGGRALDSMYAFFGDMLGFPDPLEFFELFGTRIEAFFDYPRGCVLPEFIVCIDALDADRVKVALDSIAARFDLPSIVVEGDTFYYLPQQQLDNDFPWGLCWGYSHSKLVLSSNAYAAVAAFKRAATSPLVATERFRTAMAAHPENRKMDVFVDRDGIAGLFNIGKIAVRRIERATLPIFDKDFPISDTGISISGDETAITIKTVGVAGPLVSLAAISAFDKFVTFVRRFNPREVYENKIRMAASAMANFAKTSNRMPFDIVELMDAPNFQSFPWLPLGISALEAEITPEFIRDNCPFVYIEGLNFEIPGFARNQLPVLITKKVSGNEVLVSYINASVKWIPAKGPGGLEEVLQNINREIGTNYRVENGQVVGP